MLASPDRLGDYSGDSMIEMPDGNLWVATDRALYRASADRQRLERAFTAAPGESLESLGRGPEGSLLISSSRGV